MRAKKTKMVLHQNAASDKNGVRGSSRLRSRDIPDASFLDKTICVFYIKRIMNVSRQGRSLCPIHAAERNNLFCKSQTGRAKQILGKHYLFCMKRWC